MSDCVICTRPMPDQAYACMTCGVTKPQQQLADVADMTTAARVIAHRQTGSGLDDTGRGNTHSLPFDTMATAKLDAVQRELLTWAQHILLQRGGHWPGGRTDPILLAARWLPDHLEWMRHRPEVDEFIADVAACARVVAGIARGPREQKYLGPCGAPISPESHQPADPDSPGTIDCPGDVYGHPGAVYGVCRACGASYDTAPRRAWLDDTVRGYTFTATQIAEAYAEQGVNVNTIRTWHSRGILVNHGRDRDGRPLFNVEEVLTAFRESKVRQAEAEARRNRHRKAS